MAQRFLSDTSRSSQTKNELILIWSGVVSPTWSCATSNTARIAPRATTTSPVSQYGSGFSPGSVSG